MLHFSSYISKRNNSCLPLQDRPEAKTLSYSIPDSVIVGKQVPRSLRAKCGNLIQTPVIARNKVIYILYNRTKKQQIVKMMTIDIQQVTNTGQSFTNTGQSFRLKIWNSLLFVCTFERINEMKMITRCDHHRLNG